MSIRYLLKAIYPYAIWLTVLGLLASGVGRTGWVEALEGRLVFRGAQAVKAPLFYKGLKASTPLSLPLR